MKEETEDEIALSKKIDDLIERKVRCSIDGKKCEKDIFEE